MKPIFEEERLFLKKHGITIPKNCWRKGSRIFLNSDDKVPLIVFKVDSINEKINIKKNFIKKIEGNKVEVVGVYGGKKINEIKINKTFIEEAQNNKERIDDMVKNSAKQTLDYLNKYPDHEIRISISGGKDSSVMNNIFKNHIIPKIEDRYYKYDAFNTTNEVADTYKQMYKEGVRKCDINTPIIKGKSTGWYQWIERDTNYWIPNRLKRSCCSTFKEGQAKKIMDKDKNYIILLGVRKYESVKRSFYEFDINEAHKTNKKPINMPKNWKRIAPICYWTDRDIWLYIISENLEVNPLYRYGFNRCGCLICPYNTDYTDLMIKEYFPKMWTRWNNILLKNYSIKKIGERLKWTKKEWCYGKWKNGYSKEFELLRLKKTKERVKELADIKGINEDIAEKYWSNTCSICGKTMNPDEVAMNLKYYGRIVDTKNFQCKKCFCKFNRIDQKKYSELVRSFRENECNLF